MDGYRSPALRRARLALGPGPQRSAHHAPLAARALHVRASSPASAHVRRLPAAGSRGWRRHGPRPLWSRTGCGRRLLPLDVQQRGERRPRPLDRRRRARRECAAQSVRSSQVGCSRAHPAPRCAPLRAVDDHLLPLPAASLRGCARRARPRARPTGRHDLLRLDPRMGPSRRRRRDADRHAAHGTCHRRGAGMLQLTARGAVRTTPPRRRRPLELRDHRRRWSSRGSCAARRARRGSSALCP